MLRYFCPECWRNFPEDVDRCPNCGFAIRGSWDAKDYVDKLIAALRHPEQGTPIRAAWILGRLREIRAVGALTELVSRTPDVYIATAAVSALGEIGTPEALAFLRTLGDHPARMVRAAAQRIIEGDHAEEGR